MTFSIEKGVPLPTLAGDRFPFADMEIGDSFAVPVPNDRTVEQVRANVTACASGFAKRHPGFRFVTRADRRPGGEGFVRIWRAPPRNSGKANAAVPALFGKEPDVATDTFVDPVQTVAARGYRTKRTNAPPAKMVESSSAPKSMDKSMPRFVQGKRY